MGACHWRAIDSLFSRADLRGCLDLLEFPRHLKRLSLAYIHSGHNLPALLNKLLLPSQVRCTCSRRGRPLRRYSPLPAPLHPHLVLMHSPLPFNLHLLLQTPPMICLPPPQLAHILSSLRCKSEVVSDNIKLSLLHSRLRFQVLKTPFRLFNFHFLVLLGQFSQFFRSLKLAVRFRPLTTRLFMLFLHDLQIFW